MTQTTFLLEVRHPWDAEVCEHWVRALAHAQESFGASVSAALIRPHSAPVSSADVPTCSLFEFGLRFPRLRHLRLCNIALQPVPPDNLRSLAVFAQLDTLSIEPWHVHLDSALGFTDALFSAFLHMPRLRVLGVHAPVALGRPYIDPARSAASLPEPPFSLETFSYTGAIPVAACALIISCSRGTLSELRVRLADDAAEDEVQLVAVISQAAPRLRVLHLLSKRETGFLEGLGPAFAKLTRLHTLRLGTPVRTPLLAARNLLALAPAGIPLRTLRLDHSVFPEDDPAIIVHQAKQLVADMPQTRRVTCVFLAGFYIGYRNPMDKLDLVEHWRSRRIRCKILG